MDIINRILTDKEVLRFCNFIKKIDVEPISSRLLIVKTLIHNLNFKLVVAYALTENSSFAAKNMFYLLKLCCCKDNPTKFKLIVLGDLNATTSLYKHHISINGNKPHFPMNYTANDNDDRMVDFCCEYGLCMNSTFFIHNEAKRVTWHNPDKRTKKKLDYILCEPWIKQCMIA